MSMKPIKLVAIVAALILSPVASGMHEGCPHDMIVDDSGRCLDLGPRDKNATYEPIADNYRRYCYYMTGLLRARAYRMTQIEGTALYDVTATEVLVGIDTISKIAERTFKLCNHYLQYELSGE